MSKLIKKADEMEMAINFNAMRLSWGFVMIALFAWLVYDWTFLGVFNSILLIIFSLQIIIFFSAKLLMTKKMTNESGNADEK